MDKIRPKIASKGARAGSILDLLDTSLMKSKIAATIATKMVVNQYIWYSQCRECVQTSLRIVSIRESGCGFWIKSPPF